eukprot:g4815.t1
MLEDRKMRKEKEGQVEHFMRMRENMLAKDAFTLADFRESLKDDETIVSMQKQISVLDAMTEEELADYNRLRRREKLRVAESAGITVQDLNGLLGQYENAKVMHQWLIARRERGDSLPESMDEAQSLMQFDRRGISPKSFRHVKR